jgi:hypothetical protein
MICNLKLLLLSTNPLKSNCALKSQSKKFRAHLDALVKKGSWVVRVKETKMYLLLPPPPPRL